MLGVLRVVGVGIGLKPFPRPSPRMEAGLLKHPAVVRAIDAGQASSFRHLALRQLHHARVVVALEGDQHRALGVVVGDGQIGGGDRGEGRRHDQRDGNNRRRCRADGRLLYDRLDRLGLDRLGFDRLGFGELGFDFEVVTLLGRERLQCLHRRSRGFETAGQSVLSSFWSDRHVVRVAGATQAGNHLRPNGYKLIFLTVKQECWETECFPGSSVDKNQFCVTSKMVRNQVFVSPERPSLPNNASTVSFLGHTP